MNEDVVLLANYGATCEPLQVLSCSGSYYETSAGRLLDWTAGQAASVLGHGHPEIVQIITEYAAKIDHIYSGMLSAPLLRYARRLIDALPSGLDRVFFPSTGSEANEAAIRLAKTYTGKFEIVSLGGAWHGMTSQAQATQSVTGRSGHGPLIPGCFLLPQPNGRKSRFRRQDGLYDWKAEMEFGWELIDQSSCGSLAACIVECVQGDAGVMALPQGYIKVLKEECSKRGMLLIIDEVQTGFGRTGELFAFQHEGIIPDILTLGKPIGNGIALSGVVMNADIDDVCKQRAFTFYTSHMNDPLPVAVGDKVLEIILRDNLVARSRILGDCLLTGLKVLEKIDFVAEVRSGGGMFIGVEFTDQQIGSRVSKELIKAGLWVNFQSHKYTPSALRIAPPLNSSDEEIQWGMKTLRDVITAIEASPS